MEIKEVSVLFDTKSLNSLNSLISLNSLLKSRRLLTEHTSPPARPNFSGEGCRYNARQKSRRWAVLEVLLIVGTFC